MEWAIVLRPDAMVISERFLHMPGAGEALAALRRA
jgi:hypothetical protein